MHLHYTTEDFNGASFEIIRDNASEWSNVPIDPTKPNCGYNVKWHVTGNYIFKVTSGIMEEIHKVRDINDYVTHSIL
jgi:hypothetical protein